VRSQILDNNHRLFRKEVELFIVILIQEIQNLVWKTMPRAFIFRENCIWNS